jgi:hypothetical protein
MTGHIHPSLLNPLIICARSILREALGLWGFRNAVVVWFMYMGQLAEGIYIFESLSRLPIACFYELQVLNFTKRMM